MNKGIMYITSPGVRDKKEPLFNEILSLCPDNDYSSVMYLSPNTFILTEAKRHFFSFLKKSNKKLAYIPFKSFTLRDLAASLYESFGNSGIISEHIRILILCEILRDRNIGYATLLSEFLRKIRHYLPEKNLSQFKDEVRHLIFEEKALQRAEKAVETLEKYEEELRRRGLSDTEQTLKNCLTLMKSGEEESSSLKVETLVISGFYDPTPLELRVIDRLIERAKMVYAIAEEGTELLSFLQSHKSGVKTITLKGIRPRGDSVCYACSSMEDEVEGIAKNVKNLILEGVRPWDIVVSFPALSKYLPMLNRVFKKYDVPVSIEEYELSSTKPLVTLEDMLTSLEEDYPRNEFLSFLTSPCLPAIHSAVKEGAVAYSYRAKIIKGKQSWLSVKETLLSTSENELSGDDKKRLSRFEREIRSIIDVLEGIKQKKEMLSFIDFFESALDKFGFFDYLNSADDNDLYEKISSRLSEFRRFAAMYDNPHFADTPWFYLRQLLKALQGRGKDTDGVRVVPYELAAWLEPKALFFGGLIEENFPSKPPIDPILPERVKKALKMPYLEYYINRQKQYFKRLLNISVNEPFFSYPSSEGDKIFLPSPFFDCEKPANPVRIDIFTEEDVQIAEGAFMESDAASRIFWDGSMPRDRKTTSLLKKRLSAILRQFINVTNIDSYRKCPLRFYIEKVLGFEYEEPPRFEVETRLWGSLAHKIMENLFREGEVKLEEIDGRLFQSLEQSLKRFPIGDFWASVAKEIFTRLLPHLKIQEADIRKDGFSPYKVEEKIMIEVDGLRLKGKVDRVDIKAQKSEVRNQESENKKQQRIVILLDYKTGTVDNESLQLPLYACMWQKIYPEMVEKTGFYSLKDGCVKWFPTKITMDEFIHTALETVKRLINDMRNGKFQPEPSKDGECRYCYHSPLCRAGR